MTDPNENPNCEDPLADDSVTDFSTSDANSKLARTTAGEVLHLALRSRRRLQKKFFIAKARRDVA